jgi:hypothetical protein
LEGEEDGLEGEEEVESGTFSLLAVASFHKSSRMMKTTFFLPKLAAHHSSSPLAAASSFLLLLSTLLLVFLFLLLLLGSSCLALGSSLGGSGLVGITGHLLKVTVSSWSPSQVYQV